MLGMVREMLMSHYMGVGAMTDAFVVAFKFPNFFRRFFAEGAFNAAFVPQFSGILSEKGADTAQRLAQHVFSYMAWFLFLFVTCVQALTPYILPLIAPGFSATPERVDLAITFTRITFPYILCISLTALLAGILNSLDRFWVASAAPILLNIIMILGLLLTPYTPLSSGLILSISVCIAGFVQLGWVYWSCSHAGYTLMITRPLLTDDVKRVLGLMVPGMIGAGVMQINILIDLQLASFLPVGAMSYLYYADRLYQLPLSIFGVAIGTALLPSLSKLWRANDHDSACTTQNKALHFVLFMNIPAAVGLVILSEPLIRLFFGHGKFTTHDVFETAPTLAAFACGLPAYVAGKIFSTTFFARHDTRTPVIVGLYAIGLNLVLNLILMPHFQHVGLALSTSVSAYAQTVALGYMLYKQKAFKFSVDMILFNLKTLILSISMGGIVIWIISMLPQTEYWFVNAFYILVTCSLGITYYLSASYFSGATHVLTD
jgi:putative peptidoglycan lipid II flippase